MNNKLSGVFAPVVTPFKADLSPDFELFSRHCRWLMGQGVGLAIFGTNSEANSLSVPERMRLLDGLLQLGLDPARMLPGTGCCSLTDTVELTRHAVNSGCAGVLMLPPFFYKGVSDDGLYRYYAEVIERVALPNPRLYLYHIPAFTGVPVSLALIARLIKDFPEQVVGIKDSSGDWNNIESMLRRFPDFAIFPASESFLSRAMPLGAADCVSATVNVNAGAIRHLHATWQADDAADQQRCVDLVRAIFQKYPMIAALKFAIGQNSDCAAWETQRPPLSALTAVQKAQLLVDLANIGFTMPDLPNYATNDSGLDDAQY